jgi:hypothetical protein
MPNGDRINSGAGNRWDTTRAWKVVVKLAETHQKLLLGRSCFIGIGGMGKAEEYRRYAAECRRIAQQIQVPGEKARLLQMAETWHRLAERVETHATDETS